MWQCIEVVLDYSTNHIKLYVTDAGQSSQITPIIDVGTTLTPASGFDIGLYHIAGTTSVGDNVFIDDVAIATSRIYCE